VSEDKMKLKNKIYTLYTFTIPPDVLNDLILDKPNKFLQTLEWAILTNLKKKAYNETTANNCTVKEQDI